MYFIWPVSDPERSNRGEHVRQRKISGNARSSVHLNRLIDDLQSNVWNRDLNLRNLAARPFGASLVDHPCSLKSKKSSLLQHDSGIGNDVGIRAQFSQTFAKCHTLKRPWSRPSR